MSKVRHEICAIVGKYTDSSGKEKNRYQKVGVELETDSGGRIMLLERWFNPAGIPDPENRGTVMLSLFEPSKEGQGSTRSGQGDNPPAKGPDRATARQEARPGAKQQPALSEEFTDDIPF